MNSYYNSFRSAILKYLAVTFLLALLPFPIVKYSFASALRRVKAEGQGPYSSGYIRTLNTGEQVNGGSFRRCYALPLKWCYVRAQIHICVTHNQDMTL